MTNERFALVAPCGIDCGICELYVCKDNPQLQNMLVGKGIPKEKLPCPGCMAIKGACPVIGVACETYLCAAARNAEYCFSCKDFPCSKLHPAAHRAEILPHNLKIFNLCTIRRIGLEAFIEKSIEIKKRYFTGKMAIGQGPQLP
jgi:hypothetical protein